VQTSAVRTRIVAGLVNVDRHLAQAVADRLGIPLPPALPRVHDTPSPDYPASKSLSLLARPGRTGIQTRRVALLVAGGVDGVVARHVYASLLKDGAQPRIVGTRLGAARSLDDAPLDVEVTVQATPSVMYDAVAIAPGDASVAALERDVRVLEFLREAYRHGKPLLVLGGARRLLALAGIPDLLPNGEPDPGLMVADAPALSAALATFKAALARHRVYARETDPPKV
jgi:catalase